MSARGAGRGRGAGSKGTKLSASTEALVRQMVGQNKNLTPLQKRQLNESLAKSGTLPTNVPGKSSAKPKKKPAKKPQTSSTPKGKRTHDTIRAQSEEYKRPEYTAPSRPAVATDKERLQDIMAFGTQTAEKKQELLGKAEKLRADIHKQ
eukprot:m.154048 g.154048  ORF g.154048 m.154048 type:complete len:149 (-) comp17489_c0_seq2:206-652(-)